MQVNIDEVLKTKLLKKMQLEGIEKTMTIDMYIKNILVDAVKEIVIETQPLAKPKACKKIL